MSEQKQEATPAIVTDALANQIIQNTNVFVNLRQDTIIITEDRIRLCLIKHLKSIETKHRWFVPAGIFLTILISLITASFQDFIFKASVWEAMFIISGILTFAWLVFSAIRAIRSPTLDDVVSELKKVSKSTKDSGRTLLSVSQSNYLEIIKATYGTLKRGEEVTTKLKSLIKDNKLHTKASNELAPDPDPGKRKKLWISMKLVLSKKFLLERTIYV